VGQDIEGAGVDSADDAFTPPLGQNQSRDTKILEMFGER
jgi:hypothetical protein